MRGLTVLVFMIIASLTAAVTGADMSNAARRELMAAATHARFAAGYDSTTEIELHLHHVVNCIEGKSGKNYFQPSGDVCAGMGNGLLADLKDAGMAGAHALPYVEIAQTVALWGIAQGMKKDVARTKAAASVAWMALDRAEADFK